MAGRIKREIRYTLKLASSLIEKVADETHRECLAGVLWAERNGDHRALFLLRDSCRSAIWLIQTIKK
jgi:hypothetical protein